MCNSQITVTGCMTHQLLGILQFGNLYSGIPDIGNFYMGDF